MTTTTAPIAPRPAAPAPARPKPLPVLKAANGGVMIAPDDRKYGVLAIGGQGSGKTASELRLVLNDVQDPNAAVIVMDPKSELARIALRLIDPACGKRVWYLDLGNPAFGMNPLRVFGDSDFATEVGAIADNVVAALLDINEGQIFQSSRRYLYHAVIGSLALARQKVIDDEGDLTDVCGNFHDVYELLLPGSDKQRRKAAAACKRTADLGQTAMFFERELPEDLERAGSAVAQRLDAPRNKVSGLTGVPSLRRFFSTKKDLPLREIVETKGVLLVDANYAAIGEDNAQAVMHFVFRMLHRQMQRQVQLPEEQRSRVALVCDEAHYLASRAVIKQIATHRAAGLDVTFGLQFFAQLGAAAESAAATEEIRKGVINLLQSRLMFRLGDPEDAELSSRIAMSVYQTMIRADAESRSVMRVTPEVLLNLPRYVAIASFIAGGTRAPSFYGQTYPFPSVSAISDVWERHHLERQAAAIAGRREVSVTDEASSASLPDPHADDAQASEGDAPVRVNGASANGTAPSGNSAPSARDTFVVGEMPEIPGPTTLDDIGAESALAEALIPAPAPPAIPGQTTVEEQLAAVAEREPRIYSYEQETLPELDKSRVRGLVGNGARPEDLHIDRPEQAPDSLRELSFIDRVNEVASELDKNDVPTGDDKKAVLPKISQQDVRAMQALDRQGLMLPWLVGELAMPGKSESTVRRILGKLHKVGLVGRRDIGIRRTKGNDYRGRLPAIYEITRAGFTYLKEEGHLQAAEGNREFRPVDVDPDPSVQSNLKVPHDHHGLAWLAALQRTVPHVVVPDGWRTPRYARGRLAVPQLGSGHKRRQLTPADIDLPEGRVFFDLEPEDFHPIAPDVSAEMHVVSGGGLKFDLLVEYQHNANVAQYDLKFRHYDAFLTGWSLGMGRYADHHRTRPVLVVVAAEMAVLQELAARADAAFRGAIGEAGTPESEWYYAGRDHVFFALEEDLHYGSLAAWALPSLPPKVRRSLSGAGDDGLQLRRVALLPQSIAKAARRRKAADDEA